MEAPSELDVKAGIAPSVPQPSSSTRPSTSRGNSIASAAARRTRRPTPEASSSSRASVPQTTSEPVLCQICFDDEQTEMTSLACGHTFCNDCWSTYAKGKIREEGEVKIRCMSHACTMILTDSFIRSILRDDAETVTRFQELVVRDYVDCIKRFKFCPYPSCTYTVCCPAAASKSVLSTIVPIVHCGASENHVFCFGCRIETDHRPVVCSVANLWLKKCSDDSETSNWIASNTKECPECQSTIEKNGGCK